jgi:hypothetical protein
MLKKIKIVSPNNKEHKGIQTKGLSELSASLKNILIPIATIGIHKPM